MVRRHAHCTPVTTNREGTSPCSTVRIRPWIDDRLIQPLALGCFRRHANTGQPLLSQDRVRSSPPRTVPADPGRGCRIAPSGRSGARALSGDGHTSIHPSNPAEMSLLYYRPCLVGAEAGYVGSTNYTSVIQVADDCPVDVASRAVGAKAPTWRRRAVRAHLWYSSSATRCCSGYVRQSILADAQTKRGTGSSPRIKRACDPPHLASGTAGAFTTTLIAESPSCRSAPERIPVTRC